MIGISGAVVVEFVTTVFVLATMFSMGIELSVGELRDVFGKRRLLSKSLAVNLVAVPMVAYLLVRVVPIDSGYAAGVVLLAVSPGAPFGPKLAEISESDIAFASGLMAILCLLSVVTIPVSLLVLLPGDVTVDPVAIGRMVLRVQLLPFLAGLGLTAVRSSLADRLHPPVQRLSNYTFVGLIVLLVVVYSDSMLALVGTGTLGVSTVVVAVSLALGYALGGPITSDVGAREPTASVLGGPARSTREVLATTTAARNAAIALFIATAGFSDPDVLTTVLAFSFVGVVGSALLASAWR